MKKPKFIFSELSGRDKTRYCYDVYKQLTRGASDSASSPFPMGIDPALFPNFRITIMTQYGSSYPGPTIENLIARVLRAEERVRENKT